MLLSSRVLRRCALMVGLIASPVLAAAHAIGVPHGHDGEITTMAAFVAGFLHPLSGLDHLLMIVALGLWASTGQFWNRVAMVGTFAWLVVLGALAGMMQPELPLVETLIAASVVVLGGLLAAGRKFSAIEGLIVAGVVALVHGHAHGSEIGMAAALPYFSGFVLCFLVLCLMAMGAGVMATAKGMTRVLRPVGAAIACAGVVILTGLV